jgi:xanthine dehydrogenase accessory factor
MKAHLLLLAADLIRRGEGFALATVVRRGAPTSSHVGDGALITRGGSFHGWLGGSCTQPVVVRAALAALADGAPRLIALSPDPGAEARPGVASYPMTCHSGGTVEIYIEPVLPPARVVVFGISPVARALARLAKAMGFAVEAVDPEADRTAYPDADEIFTELDGAALRQRPRLRGAGVYTVVATMGAHDEDALMAALALEPGYLGVVASRKRFAEISAAVQARGVVAAALGAIRCPAGLDIGARLPEEIALSILAEVVQRLRTTGTPASGPLCAPGAATEAQDPVCGMTVRVSGARYTTEHAGRVYYFCCAGCLSRFRVVPEMFLQSTGEAP